LAYRLCLDIILKMKNMIRSAVVSLLFIAACMAYGEVPTMRVTVSDASGKAAFKGATDGKGTFATANLKPGNYVVQFNATSGAVKGNYYTIAVAAGKKKVSAKGISGDKLTAGGVAMKVEVGAGLNITGQIEPDQRTVSKSGKKMVWIPPMTGSNFPGHWVEEGSPEEIASRTRGNVDTQSVLDLGGRR
jgi:uncharacterized protein YfiM (DUF2279 family)